MYYLVAYTGSELLVKYKEEGTEWDWAGYPSHAQSHLSLLESK